MSKNEIELIAESINSPFLEDAAERKLEDVAKGKAAEVVYDSERDHALSVQHSVQRKSKGLSASEQRRVPITRAEPHERD